VVAQVLAHELRRGSHAVQVGLVAPFRGERDRLAFEDPAHLEELAQAPFLDGEEERQRVVQGVSEVRHREGAAAPGDQPLRLEHPQRLADGRAADAVVLHQLTLRGQRVARLQMPLADQREQALRNQLVRVPALDRLARREEVPRCLIVRQPCTIYPGRPSTRKPPSEPAMIDCPEVVPRAP
jgi:hypothetical protein